MVNRLSLVFESVTTLSARAQNEAEKLLVDVRDRHIAPIALTPQQKAFVQEGLDACRRGATIDHDGLMNTISAELVHD